MGNQLVFLLRVFWFFFDGEVKCLGQSVFGVAFEENSENKRFWQVILFDFNIKRTQVLFGMRSLAFTEHLVTL